MFYSLLFMLRVRGRWLPFAYGFLAVIIALVALGYVPEGVTADGDKLYLNYGRGIVFIFIPLMVLLSQKPLCFLEKAEDFR